MIGTQKEQRRLVSVKEAARTLSCSELLIRQLVWRGEVRHVRIGRLVRIPIGELDRLMDPSKANRAN